MRKLCVDSNSDRCLFHTVWGDQHTIPTPYNESLSSHAVVRGWNGMKPHCDVRAGVGTYMPGLFRKHCSRDHPEQWTGRSLRRATRSSSRSQHHSIPLHRREPHSSLTPPSAVTMLSPAVGRVVRSSGSISTASACTLSRPVALGAVQQSFSRPSHQRRLSSSKASIPPNGSNTNGPSSPQQTPASVSKAPTRKATGRSSKKRSPTPVYNVPHVPPTNYLQMPGTHFM